MKKFKKLFYIYLMFILISIICLITVKCSNIVKPEEKTIDLNLLLYHGESSYENYTMHKLQPYDPSYFIIELIYSPDQVNLWIRYKSLYDGKLKPIDLYRDGWGSGEYHIFPDAATYLDITYYDTQPDYGSVQYLGECWIPSGWGT
ncbi:MAG: hypothetical protein NDF56_01380 [archaeon GB-1845-036]|nr:hypothetical protein [Candidatus Culexmicrobium thermophilum]